MVAVGGVIVMPLEDWVRHSRHDMFLYDWQTLIAGGLALIAGLITVWVINKQIETTVRLERERDASEASAFHAMLAAAMDRVRAEADWAKETYPQYVGQAQGATIDPKGSSRDAYVVRQCITKGAFAELRAACVRRGGDLTGEFLDLEREIDSFAMRWEDKMVSVVVPQRWGFHKDLREKFVLIETKAAALRGRAVERI